MMSKDEGGSEGLIPGRFWAYLGGKLASSLAMWMANMASAIAMYDLTQSAFMVGLVSVAQFSGPLIVSVWAGALSDRVDRRLVIMTGRGLAGAACAAIFFLSRMGEAISVEPFELIALNLLMGLGLGTSSPAMHALIPTLVPRPRLPTAVAYSSSTGNFSRAAGPALGSAFALLGDPYSAFVVAAGLHFVFVGALAGMRRVPSADRKDATKGVLAGLRHVRTDPMAARALLYALVVILGIDAALTLAPPLAAEFGLRPGWAGGFTSGFGLGALLVIPVVGRLVKRWGMSGVCWRGMALVGAGLIGVFAAPGGSAAVLSFVLAGAGFLLAVSMLNSSLQMQSPDNIRGRVMALWSLAFIGSRPVAAMLNGLLAEFWSASGAALISGIVLVLAALRFQYSEGRAGIGNAPDPVPEG